MRTFQVSPLVTTGTETRFVEADAYCRLITSRRSLVRSDDAARGLRGLLDPARGVWYVIDEQRLIRGQNADSSSAPWR
jgi:hypothetical protein